MITVTRARGHIAMTPAGPSRLAAGQQPPARENPGRHAPWRCRSGWRASTSLAGRRDGLAGTLAGQVIALAEGPVRPAAWRSSTDEAAENAKERDAPVRADRTDSHSRSYDGRLEALRSRQERSSRGGPAAAARCARRGNAWRAQEALLRARTRGRQAYIEDDESRRAQGGLTRNEETLLADGRHDRVRQYRSAFRRRRTDRDRRRRGAATGRRVIGYHSQAVRPMRAVRDLRPRRAPGAVSKETISARRGLSSRPVGVPETRDGNDFDGRAATRRAGHLDRSRAEAARRSAAHAARPDAATSARARR